MPTGDSAVGADGTVVIKAGPWAKDKLFYIKQYCYIFNVGMKNRWPIRTYIDLFAGPGRCLIAGTKDEIDGSPLIALKCEVPFTHYFFNDVEPNFIESLKARAKSFDSAAISYFTRDCNEILDELTQELPPNSLGFCFIDPTNWQINFDSIRRLTERRKMDLAVTFQVGAMKRTASNPPQDLLDFFPDSSWQQEYEKARKVHGATGCVLVEAYKRGLRDLGYRDIKDYVLEKNTRNVPLYYLIFASKNKRGAEFWDKIAWRCGTGQIRMPI